MTALTKKSLPDVGQGFTLIELLVVVAIMLILGVIFTNILIESLRGRNKVNAINQVKQNGQIVLDRLSNEIREAEKIICVGKYTGRNNPNGSTFSYKDTVVIFKDGAFSQFRFIEPKPYFTPPVNGYIQKGDFTGTDVLTSIPSSDYCTNIDPPPAHPYQFLTDTDLQKGISVSALNLGNVFEQRGDSVIIKFAASAGIKAGYAYDVTVADGGIPFTTSVQARGIKK